MGHRNRPLPAHTHAPPPGAPPPQVGLLSSQGLPVTGAEQADKMAQMATGETNGTAPIPSNGLMQRA